MFIASDELLWLFSPAEVKRRGVQVGARLPWPYGSSVYSLWLVPGGFEVFIHERAGRVVAVKVADSPGGFFYLNPDPVLIYDALLVAAGAR